MLKYINLNISQQKLIENELTLNQAIFMSWLKKFSSTGRMKSIHIGGQPFFWIAKQKVLVDLPILADTERKLSYNIIEPLFEKGFIAKEIVRDGRKNLTYIRLTQKYEQVDPSFESFNEQPFDEKPKDPPKKSKKEYISIDSKSETDVETEFNELWKEYPNRQGKAKALEHYKRQRKTLTFDFIKQKMHAYIAYVNSVTWNLSFKNGSTWFNSDIANDEYEVQDNNQGNQNNNQNNNYNAPRLEDYQKNGGVIFD